MTKLYALLAVLILVLGIDIGMRVSEATIGVELVKPASDDGEEDFPDEWLAPIAT